MDRTNATAASTVAEVQATTAPKAPVDPLVKTLTSAVQGPNGQTEEAARGLWYLGELLYQSYKALPSGDVEGKVGALQGLEGVYMGAGPGV